MFIVDTMLGTLARWLRILGFDTIYQAGMDDDEILSMANAESRIIISRDRELCGRKNDSILLRTTDLDMQIKRVLEAYPTDPEWILTRCLECNTILLASSSEQARGHVPDEIIQRYDSLQYCKTCDRFYWPGSHYDNMKKKASRFIQSLS